MQNIEEIAISNYQTNLEFFKLTDELLYNKLNALDTLLQDGRYPQRYDLEYKDGYFDVIELSSGNFLYNANSSTYSNELASTINFKKDSQVITNFYDYDFTPKALQKLENEDALTRFATTASITEYRKSQIDNSMNMIHINKFIFLGIGLGLHLPSITKKTAAKLLLLVENDIELFRLSLFTTNYKELLHDKKAYFCIAQNTEEFKKSFDIFCVQSFVENYCFKFSLFNSTYESKIKEIQTLLVSRTETAYPVEYLLYKNFTILKKLKENYKFLELSKKSTEDFFQDKPLIVIGAGPSLHTNIQWLKEHKDEFIIVAAFAALKTLIKVDITPDIVIQIDEKVTETVNLINSFDDLEFLKESIFIFNASIPDIMFEKFPKNKIYLTEDRTSYRLANTRIIALSVGEFAYAIALIFNAKQIYMLGVDFALSIDGSTHSKEHHRTESLDTSKADVIHSTVSISETILNVKGNFIDIVATTPLLAMSIPRLNQFTTRYKSEEQQVYNLSDNGAYFENTTPLLASTYVASIKLDKKDLGVHLKNIFDKYSLIKLSDAELNELVRKQTQLKEFYTIIETFNSSPVANKDLFIQNYSLLLQTILSSKESELREILSIYFLYIAPFVFDMFNTKELNNPKKHTKKMKKMIVGELYKLIELYEIELDETIKSPD